MMLQKLSGGLDETFHGEDANGIPKWVGSGYGKGED